MRAITGLYNRLVYAGPESQFPRTPFLDTFRFADIRYLSCLEPLLLVAPAEILSCATGRKISSGSPFGRSYPRLLAQRPPSTSHGASACKRCASIQIVPAYP